MSSRVHISLPVSDLDRSKRFYNAFLGAEPTKVREDYVNFRLEEPSLHLSLVPGTASTPVGTHYGIEVFSEEALGSWRERMARADLVTHEETGEVCCYAKSDKVWTRDPDGNDWEVWHRLEEADTLASSSTACCETTGCCE